MKRLTLLLLLCCWGPQAAAELGPADQLAKTGFYSQADQLYARELQSARDPALREVILCRRMAVAQLRNDLNAVEELGSQLERALKQHPNPEVEMRLHLIRGGVAYRMLHHHEALQEMEKAHQLARRLHTSGAALARWECLSYQALAAMEREGTPTVSQFENAVAQAASPVMARFPTPQDPHWPLDDSRSLLWNRAWILKGSDFMVVAYKRNDQAQVEAWAGAIWRIGMGMIQLGSQYYVQARDPETVYGILHIGAELAQALPGQEGALSSLQQLQMQLAQLEATQNPPSTELQYVQGRLYLALARVHHWHKKHAEALRAYHRSAELFQKVGRRLESIDVIAEMAYHCLLLDGSSDWHTDLEQRLPRAISDSEKFGYTVGRYYACGFLGVLKARRGASEEAEKLLRRALKQRGEWLVESGSSPRAKREMLARPESVLFQETLVEVLLRQGKAVQAAEVTDELSAQEQIATLDLARVRGRSPATEAALRQVQARREEQARLTRRWQNAQTAEEATQLQQLQRQSQAEFQIAINNLRKSDPDFERLVSLRPSSFSRLAQHLPADVLLVEYFPATDGLHLFTCSREGVKVVRAPVGRKALETEIRQLRLNITDWARNRRPEVDDTTGKRLANLYQWLVAPLEPQLQDKQTLIVLPSGWLYYVPFACLRDGSGRFLAERWSVALETGADVIELGRQSAPPQPSSLLALANPDGSLPGAQREVERLAPLFPQRATYQGAEATKERVRQPGSASVVHLATHGVLNSRDVNESYLVVADSQLKTGEIYALDFRQVSLVTLSACSTAVGEAQPGAEVASLAQAFSVAGSRTVLASLWEVDDQATAHLMPEFYKHLLAGKSRAEALRQAQLSLLKGAHPFRWASFTLIGEWR